MKYYVLCCILLFSLTLQNCKKDNSSSDEEKTGWFWIVNLDTTDDYFVYGVGLPDTILINKGGRTKLYTPIGNRFYDITWINKSTGKKTDFIVSIAEDKELTFFIVKENSFKMLYSDCYTPPKGKSLIRHIITNGDYQTLLAINSNNDTLDIPQGIRPAGSIATFDTCNTIPPATYTLLVTPQFNSKPPISKGNIDFKANKVYLVFVNEDKTLTVVER